MLAKSFVDKLRLRSERGLEASPGSDPSGIRSAIRFAATALTSTGEFDRARCRSSLAALLTEIAHVQRVHGTGQVKLLRRFIAAASNGAEYIPTVTRAMA